MKRVAGMSLIEVLVSLGMMGVLFAASYAIVQDSFRLQKNLVRGSTELIDRCNLADRLQADLRANRGVQSPAAGHWTVTVADGSLANYRVDGARVVRDHLQSTLAFQVGTTDVVIANGGVRLRFAETELSLR
ncbi:MAG: prepilin-type N-terminal cleavage/methylation domain-containing protein [Verrucomicrobiota bacterium]